jgi:hypothetical protein
VAPGSVDGGSSNPSGARARGKTGEVVAAEEEKARELLQLRRVGAASACGSPGNGCRASRGPLRSDLIQARAGF